VKHAGSSIDGQRWYDRWQAMQDCYVLERSHRFDLMFRHPDLEAEAALQVLNLGCGAGSLAFAALQHYPNARVVAVDLDPVLLAIGEQVADELGADVRFVNADIRSESWATDRDAFDLVVSATALHWLAEDNLARAFQRIHAVLKPGGWFMNSDHMAADTPETQARNRQLLGEAQQAAFARTGAPDWNGFWEELEGDPDLRDLLAARDEAGHWEGSDNGLPLELHLSLLRDCGFDKVDCLWRELGEAVVCARKP
jgi:SAM-dependent methyltransferase